MNSRKFFVLFCFVLLKFSLRAQFISKKLVSSTAQIYNNHLTLISGIGETITTINRKNNNFFFSSGYFSSFGLVESLKNKNLNVYHRCKIFPNPTKGELFIVHPSHHVFDVMISDSLGKDIYSLTQKSNPLSIQNLAPGIYFITISIKNKNLHQVHKIIKQ